VNEKPVSAISTLQCEICLDSPPYTKCAGVEAPESASCAYIAGLERRLRAAEERAEDQQKMLEGEHDARVKAERQFELSQAEARGANRTVGELAAELAEAWKRPSWEGN